MADGCFLNIWDIGGQTTIRSYWRNYYEQTDAIIWVVDSTDASRFSVVWDELSGILEEEQLQGASLLILANKQDLPGAVSAEDIGQFLQLDKIETHVCKIFPCSALSGWQIKQGFEWMLSEVKERLYCGAKLCNNFMVDDY